jgi:hypothetical protein
MKKIIAILLAAVIFSMAAKAAATDTTVLSMQVGGSVKNAYLAINDLITGTAINATFSNVVVQNNNTDIATIIVNPLISNGIKATPLIAGSGTAVVSCHVSYTDPGDGQQKSEDKTIVIAYAVTGAPHGIKLSLSFN